MRYTARTRSIEWKADAATRAAVACLEALLDDGMPHVLRVRLDAGMGLVATTCCTTASAFVDDPQRPRLLLPRALPRPRGDPAARPDRQAPWRNG